MRAPDEATGPPVSALDPLTFPLRGSRLIEASAGTGKTYTLALLYTRLILGHGRDGTAFERPLTPPEILVVTFTVAATQELRERIRARLVEAAALFEQTPPAVAAAGPDPLYALRDDYPPAAWPGCARRLRQAAEWMDEAMITTIHAWCQRMLQQHAFATRGSFERELVTDQTDLIAEILRDYWRVHFYPLDAADAHSIAALLSSPDDLQQRLLTWLGRREAPLSFQGRPLSCDSLAAPLAAARERRQRQQAAAALEDAARALWRAHQTAIEAQLWTLRPHLNGQKHASANEAAFAQLLAAIARWSHGDKAPSQLEHFAQGAFAFKQRAPIASAPPHPAFAALADWQQAVTASNEAADDGPALEACVLAHAAAWIERELPKRLQRRAEMGFDDLLRDLDAVLNPSVATPEARALAEAIRRRFPVALIDEFQDTDPIQYRIFDAIYQVDGDDPNRAIILIGDPKQAIYGFRGADIHAYLAARRATRGRHATLATNYRSSPAMVEAGNRLFGFADRHPRGAFRMRPDPGADNPIPYVQVTARERAERLLIDGAPATAMTLWWLDGDGGVLSPDAYRERMAAVAASEVVRWLTPAPAGRHGFLGADGFTPLRPQHIAVLVRTGTEAAAMRRALAARRVNSVYLSDRDSVFQTDEARDLLVWLRACAAPNDERLVRAALATNTLAIPLATLDRWQRDELAWDAQIERFGDYQRIWQRQGVLAMLRRLLHDQDLPGRLVARERGERILTNLLHLAEWLQAASVARHGEQALIRHLIEHLGQGGEEFVVRLESDAELIQIVTIHKSKGLEYPLVLLPFVCGWREVDGHTRQVPYRPPATAPGPGVAARYLEVAGKNRFPDAWAAADDERLSEEMRLLYVAVTRARHAVWLGIAPLKSGQAKVPQLDKSAFGHLLTGGRPLPSAAAIREALEALRGPCEAIAIVAAPPARPEPLAPEPETPLEPARQPTHAAFPPWWIASYSGLLLGVTALAGPPRADEDTAADTAAHETALEESAFPPRTDAEGATPDPTGLLHGFPRGSRYGTFLHGLLEWAAAPPVRAADGTRPAGYAAAARAGAARRDMLARRSQLRGLTDWIEPLDAWLAALLTRRWTLTGLAAGTHPAPSFRLTDLAADAYQIEMEFWIESHDVDTAALERLVRDHCLPGEPRPGIRRHRLNGLLKGFIDLTFEHQGRYYVLDWKSNWLGPDDAAYTPEAMRRAMLEHRYDLQYALYLLALHRQLRARRPGYDYDRDLGGAIYCFVRGSAAPSQGLFVDRPPRALIEGLDRLFAGTARPGRPAAWRADG